MQHPPEPHTPTPAEPQRLLAERDALAAENAELRDDNAKISAFVNHLVHELRTPLTSISGFSEFLLKHAERQSPERLRYYCEILFLESSRLARMVDTLLDLSRMRAGKMGLQLVPCDLGSLVELCCKNLQIQAAERHIDLSSAVSPAVPLVRADADKLQQVLTNLVANALSYSPEGARVEAGVRREPGRLLCWVRDTGVGIAEQDRERIFDEFYRVEGDGAAGAKGTGLGLPISRAIVELHGGRLWVESEPGQGSTFFFTLPLDEQ
jgi:two-component system, OmpR family, phosphate regulon sensor histidine kinase PhoR